MRILFLADATFADIPGGSRLVAREMARGLTARGHEVTILAGRQSPDGPDDFCMGGVRIIRYPGSGNPLAFIRKGRRACARLWAEHPFDVVHTHFAYSAIGPLKAVPASVPRVRTFHGPWDEEGWVEDCHRAGRAPTAMALVKKRLRFQVEAANLAGSARVITLSEGFRQMVMKRYGVPVDDVQSIPGGADLDRFRPTLDKRLLRQELGLPQDRTLLLSIRRLAPRMGLDNLIRAMPAVVARHPDVLLLIGGQGPERERLERLVAELGMWAYVRLLGFIPDDQLGAHFQVADLFVLPTLSLEGFGLVTTEALACGVPVVGTPVGATPQILAGLDKHLIAPGTTPDALAQAVLSYFDGGWSGGLTPERLHRYVADHYTWNKHVVAVEALYTSLLDEPERLTETSALANRAALSGPDRAERQIPG